MNVSVLKKKSHRFISWYRISIVISELCFGKKPKAIEI